MLLKLFRSNHPVLLIFMAFIAGLLWLPVIINPQWEPLEMAGTSLYKSMVDGILPHVWYQQLLALLLMVMEAYFLIRLNFKYIFIETKTYLPTVFFIFITSVFAKNQLMLPVLLANLFFLFAIDRSFEFEKESNQFKRFFESGLFIGLGSLFYSPLTFYMLLIFLTLFTIRYFNWREFVSIVLGYATPLVFYMVYLLFNNRFEIVVNEYILLFVTNPVHTKISIPFLISAIVFAFFAFVAIFSVANRVRMRKISTRKYFSLFFWLFALAVIFYIFVPAAGFSTICFISLALSIIFALFFVDVRNKIWGEVSFTMVILSIISLIYFL